MRSIRSRFALLVICVALVAAACAEGEVGSSSTSSTSTSTSLGTTTSTNGVQPDEDPASLTPNIGDLHIIVPVGADGLPDASTRVTCGGASFTLSDLDGVKDLSGAGLPDVEAAIQPFLQSAEGAFWPQDGWMVLSESQDAVTLVHIDPEGDSSLAFMSVERSGGDWKWAGSSMGEGCGLEISMPAGLNAVDWRFDPSYPEPNANSTTLYLLVTERECASGQAVGDRLVGPEVVVTDTHVHVAFAATAQAGDQTCPSNPETAVTVELSAPIGSREVVDGLTFGVSLQDLLAG